MRFFLLFLLFSLAAGAGHSSVFSSHKKPTADKPAVLKTDSSSIVNIRHFDSVSLKAYSKQPEFQYHEESTDLSGWERFWHWFWNWFSHLFDFRPSLHTGIMIWRIIELLLIAGGLTALVFLILKATGINLFGIFKLKPTTTPIPYSEFFEDINSIDFDAEIEHALSNHNYRFAVRLLYLKSLKRLSDAGLIAWQIDKTNSTYITELANHEQRKAFGILTNQFEYVWYGDFVIDGPVYKNIDLLFRDFNQHIA